MATKKRKRAGGRASERKVRWRDLPRHALYEAAVQNVESDADFVERVYREARGRRPRLLREDFCGTASLAAHWVGRHPDNRAYGTDLDRETLDWGLEHRVGLLGDDAERVELDCGNVLDPHMPRVDVQVAFNFSYFTFHRREELGRYFRAVRGSLADDGIFVLDLYGGSESMTDVDESTEVEGRTDPAGWEIPDFEYLWEQRDFNPIDHRLHCYIHFRCGSKKVRRREFVYDWRFWTIPELSELLVEARFATPEVYVEGWDDEEEAGDGDFQKSDRFDNDGGWLAYLVAVAE